MCSCAPFRAYCTPPTLPSPLKLVLDSFQVGSLPADIQAEGASHPQPDAHLSLHLFVLPGPPGQQHLSPWEREARLYQAISTKLSEIL